MITRTRAREGEDLTRLRRHDAEGADAAGLFFHNNLRANAFFEDFDVGNDADGLFFLTQSLERGDGDLQRLGVEAAEAFVDEERLDAVKRLLTVSRSRRGLAPAESRRRG